MEMTPKLAAILEEQRLNVWLSEHENDKNLPKHKWKWWITSTDYSVLHVFMLPKHRPSKQLQNWIAKARLFGCDVTVERKEHN